MPISVSLWKDLGRPVFDGVGQAHSQCFPVGLINSFFLSPTIFYFSSFHGLVVYGWGLRIDIVFSLSPNLALLTLS